MLNQVAAKIPRAARALAVVCVLALSVACGASDAPAEPSAPAPAALAPTAKPIASHAPETAGAAGAEPAPSAPILASIPAQGATTPEELIFLSDVVARVRLLSAEAGVRRYPSEYRRGPDPVLAFRFRVIEYLKGSGDDELTVRVIALNNQYSDVIIHPSPTPDANAALRTAQARLAERDTRWDSIEAVVFLRPSLIAAESGVYEFTARAPRSTLDTYAITSDYNMTYVPNRAWLPGGVPSVKAAAEAATDSSSPLEPRYFTSAPNIQHGAVVTNSLIAVSLSPASPSAPSLALSEIKSLVATHEDMLTKGKDIPGYEECVRAKFEFDALYKKGNYISK